jgi:hypothetical protein
MVCVVVEDSNHPVCQPISMPTPNPDGTNVVSSPLVLYVSLHR